MGKIIKQILASVLTIVIFLCEIQVGVFAQQDEQIETESGNSVSVNTDNDFSKIVMSKVESDSGNKDLYGVTDIEIRGTYADVHLSAPDDSTLIVAVYNDSGKMVGYGVASVTSSQADYNVSLSEIDFPEYYTVKGFILDKSNAPVCDEYVNREYSREYEEFMDLTVSDFDMEYVMNFDDDELNNFAVLREGTVIAETARTVNVLENYDEATDTYIISNADSVIKGLKTGDVLYLKTGEENSDYIIVSVKTISVSENNVKIISNEETVESVFDCIKIDSTGGLSEENVKNAQLGDALTLVEQPVVHKAKSDTNIESSMSKSVKTEVNYKSPEDGGNTVEVTGSLKLDFTASLKIYYDAKLFKEDYFEYRFSHEEKLEFEGGVTGKVSVDKEKVKIGVDDIPIAGTPLTISLNVYPIMEFSGSITFDISCTSKFTQTYNPYDGQREIQEKDKDFDCKLKTKIEIKFGIEVSLEVKAVKILSLEVSASAIIIIKGELDGYLKCFLDKYHYCDSCVEGNVNFVAGVDLTVNIEITKKLKWDLIHWQIAEASVKLCDFYVSNLNGSYAVGFTTCPNKMYKVDFTVSYYDSDSNKVPLVGASVSLGGGQADTNGDGKFDATTVKTDKYGKASAYYEVGNYSVKVSANGYPDKTISFHADSSTPVQDIILTKWLEPTENDWQELNEYLYWARSGTYFGYSFDCNSPDALSQAYDLICDGVGSALYSYYFNDDVVNSCDENMVWYDECDPLKRFNYPNAVYYKLSADNVDWIISFILNTEVDRKIDSNDEKANCYYYADNFYLEGCWGGSDISKLIFQNKTARADGTYYMSFAIVYDNEVWGYLNFVAGVKEYNGRRYWSFEKISSTEKTVTLSSDGILFNSDTPKLTDSQKLYALCSSCKAGNDYILMNVRDYSAGFVPDNSNLLYIDQFTADENGKVFASFIPIADDPNAITVLIGDFGLGVEAHTLNALTMAPSVKSVSIDDIEMNYKKTATLNAVIGVDEGVNYTVEYSSSNPSVARVDENGNVYGGKKGSADITVTVTDEYGNSVSDTCNVKVKYSFGQWLIVILLFGWIWY